MEKPRGIKITNTDKQKQCDIHVVVCSVCGWSKEKDKECGYCIAQYARNWRL